MSLAVATFGSGGAEPYARALRRDDDVLYLRDARAGSSVPHSTMNAARWSDDADATDIALLRGVTGPVLDIGCGPGRMVRAANDLGLVALGIDVSPTAVAIARAAGLQVREVSVFEMVPLEGSWATGLLVDGNIGIGGDPSALMARCRELISPDGSVVVEVNSEPLRDDVFIGTLADIHGEQSDEFPWAEIGSTALARRSSRVGLRLAAAWAADGRSFTRFVRA
ncbi:class I SAM-dependent methyltransferase [Lacisediminihabitans changchengi]|uniref:class I SAM-dependent methyltransferase n=1 Tax=Lacisediminihabitans changchengi TaxID=2787634 RepID=UPI0027DC5C95|nr:class I SAM-dependent methyltransferase [Lacisediminihabitans changchengi]